MNDNFLTNRLASGISCASTLSARAGHVLPMGATIVRRTSRDVIVSD